MGLGSAYAQRSLAGKVVNRAGEGIPYCAIGIRHTQIGTLADEQGRFKLMLGDTLSQETLVFSAVGYQDKSVSDLPAGREATVVLESDSRNLREVVVSARKTSQKVVGEKSRPLLTFSRMFDHKVSAIEQGTIVRVPASAWLNTFNFYIMPSSRYSQITLKVNVYEASGGLPGRPLQKDVILYKTTTTGWQAIDLSSHHLRAGQSGKVAVTLQLIDLTGPAQGDFIFGLSAKKSLATQLLFRYQSQANWEKHSGTFIANLAVSYTKDKAGDSGADPTETPEETDLTTRTLTQVYLSREKAKNTSYGRSAQGRYLDTENARLYYEEYGQGEPLVLLHGNGGSIADFYEQIPAFSKNYRVIAVDTRGQGKSVDRSTADYSYDTFASDLATLITHLNLSKVTILGWSDGGNTGLTYARNHPDEVTKLITIGANLSPEGVQEEVLTTFKSQLKQDSVGRDNRLVRLMLTHPHLTADDLEKIHSPVLVIAGQHDVILEAHTRHIQKLIKNARLTIFPNASHYLPFEQPQELNQVVLSFLKE